MELALGAWSNAASRRRRPDFGAPQTPPVGQPTEVSSAYFGIAPVALCVIDRQRRFEAVNERMGELLETPAATLSGRFAASVLADADTLLSSIFAKADAGERLRDFEVAWRGRRLQLSFTALVRNARVGALCIAATDITRRVRTEELLLRSRRRLFAIATQDYLTGLLNRRGFETRLRRELRWARATGSRVAVLLVDIDHFKLYNDHFGHPAGDKCLRAVSAALEESSRGIAAFARYGGEEFALVVSDASPKNAADLADRCRRSVSSLALPHPASALGHVTISVGVAVLDVCAVGGAVAAQAAELLRVSDESLYCAKQSGRDQVSASVACRSFEMP